MTLSVGQIWREVDSRFERFIRVEKIGENGVIIRTVARGSAGWKVGKRSRLNWAEARRFNGKSGGYEFIEEPLP
jgi:hypothetical protein